MSHSIKLLLFIFCIGFANTCFANTEQKLNSLKGVVINEVSADFDWIELYNNSDETIILKGYHFTHKNAELSYTIPFKNRIKPGAFYVIYKKSKVKRGFDFSISKKGDIQLFSPDKVLIDSIDLNHYDTPKNGSIGRFPNGTGAFTKQFISTSKKPNFDHSKETLMSDLEKEYAPYILKDTHHSDYIFNQDSLQRFDLWLEDSALNFLDSNPADEVYVHGALIHNDTLLSNIGIRYKGSVGAFVECVSGKNLMKPSGKKTCTKLSMKVKIDFTDKQAKFYGLTKLQFHSQNLDPSKMHERLGYWLYQQASVPAPRSVHAKLYINGQYNGVFALTEQIDQALINRHFENNSKGNLYKEVWPLTSLGEQNTESAFINALKTNKKRANVSDFIAFSNDLAQISFTQNKEDTKALMHKWFDMDQLIRALVVDRSIKADDGVFHWYCSSNTQCENHNYYWYQSENKQAHLIHWDLDNAFENLGEPKNPVTFIEDSWNQTRNDCNNFPSGPWNIPQKSAACDKLIYAFTLFENEFNDYKSQFEKTHYNPKTINALLDAWQHQIKDAVLEAAEKHDDQISVTQWHKAVEKLKADISHSIKK